VVVVGGPDGGGPGFGGPDPVFGFEFGGCAELPPAVEWCVAVGRLTGVDAA
jgi:hypothetical protein